jgi:hypothetical protein
MDAYFGLRLPSAKVRDRRTQQRFYKFSALPLEVRRMIWRLSTETRVIRIATILQPKWCPMYWRVQAVHIWQFYHLCDDDLPPLLHVCKESRQEALSIYQLIVPSTYLLPDKRSMHQHLSLPRPIYFDPRQDILHFECGKQLFKGLDKQMVPRGEVEVFLLDALEEAASHLIRSKASMLLFHAAPYSMDTHYNSVGFVYGTNFINLTKSFAELLGLSEGMEKEPEEVDEVISKSMDF